MDDGFVQVCGVPRRQVDEVVRRGRTILMATHGRLTDGLGAPDPLAA